jgi:exosortase/archaeosortase family protein
VTGGGHAPLRRVLFFALAFALIYGATRQLPGFESWFIERLVVPAAAWTLNGVGSVPVAAIGDRLSAADGGLVVRPGCEGLDLLLLWIAAITVSPFGWRAKLLGWTVGSGLVFGLNQLRLISLFTLYRHRPDWFGDAHGLWWPLLLVAAVFMLYLLWQRFGLARPAADPARLA